MLRLVPVHGRIRVEEAQLAAENFHLGTLSRQEEPTWFDSVHFGVMLERLGRILVRLER